MNNKVSKIVNIVMSIISIVCSGMDFAFCIENFRAKEYWLSLFFLFFGLVLFKQGFGYWKRLFKEYGWIGRDMEQ